MIHSSNKQYKIVLVGDSSVGKSSILNRFVDDQFIESLISTIGVDFKFRKIMLNGKEIKLQIWDTAGQQIFRAIVSAYYNSADAIVAVYDISSFQSFQNLKDYWLPQIENQNRSQAKIFILGNKNDLQKRQVEPFNIQNLMETHKVQKCYQVSAKESTNIENAFIDITKILQGISSKDAKSSNTSSSSYASKEKQKPKKSEIKKVEQSEVQNKETNIQPSKQQQKKQSRFGFSSWRKKSKQVEPKKPPKKEVQKVVQSKPKQTTKRQQVKQVRQYQQPIIQKPRQNIRQYQQKVMQKPKQKIEQQQQPVIKKPKQNIALKKPPTRQVSYSKQCCPT